MISILRRKASTWSVQLLDGKQRILRPSEAPHGLMMPHVMKELAASCSPAINGSLANEHLLVQGHRPLGHEFRSHIGCAPSLQGREPYNISTGLKQHVAYFVVENRETLGDPYSPWLLGIYVLIFPAKVELGGLPVPPSHGRTQVSPRQLEPMGFVVLEPDRKTTKRASNQGFLQISHLCQSPAEGRTVLYLTCDMRSSDPVVQFSGPKI